MDMQGTIQQVYGPKNAFSKLIDLSDTFLQVDGPLVHFTQIVNWSKIVMGSGYLSPIHIHIYPST
jgi:hypothetical protein